MTYQHEAPDEVLQGGDSKEKNQANSENIVQYKREHKKLGRNEQCYCGSGKKYKNCHGNLSASNDA